MFVQIIEGKIADAQLLERQLDAWRKDIKPGATGFLGATGGITPDGRTIDIVRFESEAAAQSNSKRPEQGAWWSETEKAYDGPVTFRDCRDVDVMFGGGSNDAGFVQVVQGKAKDQAAMRSMTTEMEAELRAARPDILGMLVAWHGDGGFTQVVYFKTEADARKQESATEQSELRERYMSMFEGAPTFYDLPSPIFD